MLQQVKNIVSNVYNHTDCFKVKKIIDELPPLSVMAQYKAIREELRKYNQLPDKICHAISLLNATKPHLNEMKSIIGSSNSVYIKLSTQVVGNALHNVIEEVNDVQKDEAVEFQGRQISLSLLLDRDMKIAQIKSVLKEAWEATKIMDTFDMEAEFKANRYMGNRRILKNMCDQLGVSSSTVSPTRRVQSVYEPDKQPKLSSGDNTGCIVWLVLVIITVATIILMASGV